MLIDFRLHLLGGRLPAGFFPESAPTSERSSSCDTCPRLRSCAPLSPQHSTKNISQFGCRRCSFPNRRYADAEVNGIGEVWIRIVYVSNFGDRYHPVVTKNVGISPQESAPTADLFLPPAIPKMALVIIERPTTLPRCAAHILTARYFTRRLLSIQNTELLLSGLFEFRYASCLLSGYGLKGNPQRLQMFENAIGCPARFVKTGAGREWGSYSPAFRSAEARTDSGSAARVVSDSTTEAGMASS